MAKILFLTPYPKNEAPSQRFRFEQYHQILKSSNFELKYQAFLNNKSWNKIYNPETGAMYKSVIILIGFLKRLRIILTCNNYHYIFIHRELAPIGPPVFEWIISKVFKKEVIYDFDDAIWLVDNPSEPSIITFLKWRNKFKYLIKWSFHISCGNEYLAKYARKYNPNISINPTTIDTSYHIPRDSIQDQDSEIVIGWTGTHTTLKYLSTIIPIIKDLGKLYSFKFMIICNQNPEFDLECYRFTKWDKETEIEDLHKVDIGIMPLENTDWELGKCGFKALQFMALEIPVCISPVGVNNSIVDHGIDGFHCNSNEDWKKYLLNLILSPEKRIQFGKLGREKIIKNYSVISNSGNFLSLFK